MSTLRQVIQSPIPYDLDRAAEAREEFADLPENLQDLIAGTAGCSSYLNTLLQREANWLRTQIDVDLDTAFQDILSDISGESFQSLLENLRTAKRRAALLSGLADLGGLWTLFQVTGALTALADKAVQVSLVHLVGAEIARGKLPGCTADDAADAAGMVALAMGKMGAGELNYSSDIDLIMLFDETRHDPENYAEVRASFIRVTQRMVKLLSEITGGGYVFRTDLRLRPDPSVTPVCIAMEPAERYYESLGRTWERAAFIKARPCAGAIDAGWAFLERLKPFIWRKHLDFAAIQDAHDMRLRIREHKGLHGPISIAGHDMKLGRGGIREIEFFTQTRQIICGGRDREIRQRETLPALKALTKGGWVDADIAAQLSDAYIFHRTIEHRLQMLEDAQTHKMPNSDDKRDRLAAFCGAKDRVSFEHEIEERLQQVHDLTESFFTNEDAEPAEAAEFANASLLNKTLEKWATLPSMRSERAERIFARLWPEILARLAASASPEDALIQFDAFLSGLPAGVQLFSLFEANPHLLELLADICASAPALAQYLGKNAQVFDAVVGSDFFENLPEYDALLSELSASVDEDVDYEFALDTTRRWVKEQQFRIGVHSLRQISSNDEVERAYSDVSEVCLNVLYPIVCGNFSKRYGPPPGKGAAIVAMGKLGSKEMTATSDLDLIVIYDAEGIEYSTGPKSLAISTYYARLTQAFLSAITVPTAEGALYEVDMRLRPSGRQGPVATSINAFKEYQKNDAWTWEHLALTRARVVVGNDKLASDIEAAITEALCQPHDHVKVISDVAEMRDKLTIKASANPWNVKDGAGRLMDIELLLQTGAVLFGVCGTQRPIDMLPSLVKAEWLTVEQGTEIRLAVELFKNIQQIARLAYNGPIPPEGIDSGFAQLLLNATNVETVAKLEKQIGSYATKMTQIVASKL